MSTELSLYKKQMQEAMGQYTEVEKIGGGQFITTRAGVLKIGEDELPGNQMAVIILDSVFENTLYEGRFDANNMAPPVCYAFGRNEDELAPHVSMQEHPDVFAPQATDCAGCEFAKWGSSDTGRGKACQNRRRLAVIPAGQFMAVKGTRDFDLEVFETEEHYANASMAMLKLPVTSTENYSRFVQDVAREYQLPPFGVIAHIYLEPDPKTQYKVKFDVIEPLPDALIGTILARNAAAKDAIITPYTPFEERNDQPQNTGQRNGLRGLKRN